MARTRTYTYTAYIEHPEDDSLDYEVNVVYTFSPGYPEQGPSYSSGGEPAEPPEVEIQSITRVDDKSGTKIHLTDVEEASIHQWLVENPPEPDEMPC